jgi:iron complex outermembrane receptor protein
MHTKSNILAAILCATPSVIYAAIDEFLTQNVLPEISITASRFEENLNHVPANVRIITREDIENSSSNNIPEVLSQLGGLVINGTNLGQLGLGASVDLGGYGATANSNTLILLDGQSLNPIDSSSVSWESIPLGSVQRIEILRGGASVQYGNGAVGGVINIITRDGRANLNNVSVKAGSFGTIMTNAVLSTGSGNTSLRLNANTANTNGWRENSAAKLYSFRGKLTEFLNGPNEIYLGVNASHSNAQAPGGVVGEVGQGNPQLAKFNNVGSANAVDNTIILLGNVQRLNDKLTFEGEVIYSSQSSNFHYPYYASMDSIQNWSWNLTPRIKADWGQWGTTVLGYDINKSNSVRLNNTGDATLINRSPYIIERYPLTSSVEVSGGFRRQTQTASAYDANAIPANASKTYSANAADLAFNFSYLEGQKTFFKWNQSFRFPNTDEFWGFDPNTFTPVFNGILQPQQSQTVEFGGEWRFWKTQLTASIFQSNTRHEIRYDPVTSTNLNESSDIHRKGFLFDSTTYATSKLTVSAGGKFQRSLYAGGMYSGSTISLVPDLTFNARANYTLNERWNLGGVVTYIGSQYYDGDLSNTLHKIPSATVTDVYSSYKSGSWETRLTIKNLAGANYATSGGYNWVSMPNGSFIQSYYYYPSDPRAYYLTLKHAF